MGYGDEIMATAFAKIEKKKYPERQVVVGDAKARTAKYSKIYYNNPNISDPRKLDQNKIVHFVDHNNSNRPYIDWTKSKSGKLCWNINHRAIPGELYFDKQEINEAENVIKDAKKFWKTYNSIKNKGIIFIETSRIIKKNFMPKQIYNRNWSPERWEKTIDILKKSYLIVNSTHAKSFKHDNIFSYGCEFRVACAIMKYCDIYLGPEGGFAHAAAALSKPAVVIFGGWITPKVTGYEFHENLYVDIEGSPCGIRDRECDHCKKCMDLITVDNVVNAVERNINKKIYY